MADVLRRTGPNLTLIPPDLDGNITLNGSSPGDLDISSAGFSAVLWENGAPTPFTLVDLLSPPFSLTIDNVSDTFAPLGMYRVNLTLPNRSLYELWIKHTPDMVAFRQETFDLVTRAEVLSLERGNTRYTYRLATVPAGAPRNVAVGVLDTILVETRLDGTPDFSAPNLVSSKVIELSYAAQGQTNPVLVEPG